MRRWWRKNYLILPGYKNKKDIQNWWKHIVNNDVKKKRKKELLLTIFVLSTTVKTRFFRWKLGNLWFLQCLRTFFLIFLFIQTYYTSPENIFKWIQMQILIFLSFFVTHFHILFFMKLHFLSKSTRSNSIYC